MADTAFSSADQLAADQGLPSADFSKVETVQPGQTPTGQYYLNNGNPTVYKNSGYDANAASNDALAKSAGAAGLSVADYQKLISESAAVTPEQKAKIYSDLGIPAVQTAAYAPPDKSTEQLYNDAYGAAGLGDLKTKISGLDDTINDKKTKLNAALGTVNENPWLDEATRVGRTGQLQTLANADINNAIAEQASYQKLYDQGVTEVNGVVTRHTADYQTNQTLAQAHLADLQKQADAAVTAAQTANSAKLDRYAPDYLAAAANSKAPDTVQAKDGTIYQWDKTTGQFTQIKGPNSSTGTDTGSTPSYVVDAATDAGVQQIIAANPGEWGHAADAIDKKYGAGTSTTYDAQLKAVYQKNQSPASAFAQSSVPDIVAPYVNKSYSGVTYVDASTLQGTAAQKNAIVNAAQKAGLKVITNKNTAADLSNIADANNKLDTIAGVMSSLTQPDAFARNLHNMGLTQFAVAAQTDPQRAAAGALQSVGLDMLKAISGVQGFRGNATVIQQINDHLPTIYDTTDVANQKIDYLRKLMTDREDGLLGKPASSSSSTSSNTNSGGSTFNGITLPN